MKVGHAGRWLAFIALALGSWFLWAAIQRPIVSATVALTGGPTGATGTTLTLHRYIVIGVWRTLWWLAVTWLAARIIGHRLIDLSWHRRSPIDLAKGMVSGGVLIAAIIGCIVAAGAARLVGPGESVLRWLPTALLWLSAEALIAASEELLFRVLLFGLLRHLVGTRAAALVSALLFTAAHGDAAAHPLFALTLMLIGLILAIAIRRSGAIWWPIGIHAGWNWTCATLFGAVDSGVANDGHVLRFQPLGPALLDGGAIGPEASLFTPVILAAVLLWLWFTRRQLAKGRHS